MSASSQSGEIRRADPAAALVSQALRKHAVSVGEVGGSGFRFELANGSILPARAGVHDGWLLFEASLRRTDFPVSAGPALVATLLRLNAGLSGQVKFVQPPGGALPRLRAELPLNEAADVAGSVAAVCAGFTAAAARLHGEDVAPALFPADGSGDVDLPALCEASGWPFQQRDPSRLAVDLNLQRAVQTAIVAMDADRRVNVSATVGAEDDAGSKTLTPDCQHALGLLLLRTSAFVRFARGADSGAGGDRRFEVVFDTTPAPAQLGDALAALSVACDLAAREAVVLCADESVAREYVTANQSLGKEVK